MKFVRYLNNGDAFCLENEEAARWVRSQEADYCSKEYYERQKADPKNKDNYTIGM